MNKVQKLFQELGHEEAIKFLTSEPLNIKAKEYAHFYVLNYCQIFSPEIDDYVLECRSLQIAKDCTIISRAFPRFFNYGQRPEITGKFDFDSATFTSKEDGSLIRVYWNPFELMWEIATRSTAYAESAQDYYPTFRQAVIEDGFGFKDETEFQDFCNNNFHRVNTYVFEYCSMKNNIVTPYENPQMVMTTVIDNETGVEVTYEDLCYLFMHGFCSDCPNIRLVKEYKFNSFNEMKDALDNLPDLQEGFVAKDKNGLRVKFKNSTYTYFHGIKTKLNAKNLWLIAREENFWEIGQSFPEIGKILDETLYKLNQLYDEIDSVYNTYFTLDQKSFANEIKRFKFSSVLFSMKKLGICNSKQIISKMTDNTFLNLIF